ncbi:uncharacterized protein (DUF427 family) [Nonlabens dokdonensis]|jgi:uncharacterized protein (DUF427 family)|uniref:DUF427 domain containing protein n=2 Tax=Nonlabens dokdonensis TaxID=328515 RepID=L7WC44_NONDD|nr:DUF427 domain-containing protein [Nonlabens dokdonensis]AGC77669.1 DUF427 domain containing protein [Nonlabens dokdonensis DSW-6]PZX39790.1 uncharacterized protein (DUF427 family) [Nonlabens dokdonensis]
MNINKDRLQKARDGWSNRGNKRPPFAIEPEEGQRSVWDFPRPPVIEKVTQPVLVQYQGDTIVDTQNALAVLETASPPTYYIPREDVNLEILVELQGKSSFCEWKGKADYFAIKENQNRPVAWSYANPLQEFADLKDYLAFYPQHLECFVDGNRVKPQPGEFYAGWITPDLTGPFKGESGTGHW